MAFDIPIDTYETALDTSISARFDTLSVDARGYSPTVARREGSDYMDGELLFFDTTQFNEDIERAEYSFLDTVLDRLQENHRDYLAAATAAGPVKGELDLDIFTDRFQVTTTLSPVDRGRFEAVQDAAQELQDLDAAELGDAETLEASLDRADDIDATTFHDVDDRERRLILERETFAYENEDGTLYVIHDSDPTAVRVGDGPALRDLDLYAPDWSSANVDTLIDRLEQADRLEVQEDQLEDELDRRSEEIVNEAVGIAAQDKESVYPDVAALFEEKEADGYEALKRLDQEGVTSITSEEEREKALFYTADDPVVASLLDDVAETSLADIDVWTFDGQGENMTSIKDAYREWNEEFSFGISAGLPYKKACEFVTDLDYNPETIYSFCEEYPLSRNDGVFVAALINNAEEDRFRLPDMSRVRYVGYRNEDDVIVEGNTGNYPAEEMEDGRLEIKGDVDAGTGWIGDEMTGGTVYVHGDGKRDPHKEGGSIVKSSWRPAFRKRPSNDDAGLFDDLL